MDAETCDIDTDCHKNPYFICDEGICKHKAIFPMLPWEFAGIFILPFLIGLSNVAGIGGSGLVIPLVMSFWGFETKQAI